MRVGPNLLVLRKCDIIGVNGALESKFLIINV